MAEVVGFREEIVMLMPFTDVWRFRAVACGRNWEAA